MQQSFTRSEWLGPELPPKHAHIVLLVPAGYGTLECGTMSGIFDAVARGSPDHSIEIKVKSSSALTLNFNNGWAEALNARKFEQGKLVGDGTGGVTHFAMIHTDICPLVDMEKPSWLDVMWRHMYQVDAEDMQHERRWSVVSAVSPIKNPLGLTSTGLDIDRWRPRRLTNAEVDRLPNVLDNETLLCGERFAPEIPLTGPAGPLIINTGLWLADIRGRWADHICFNIDNRIVPLPDGTLTADFEPEDWRFARDMYRMGVPYCAVRDVHLNHMGPQAWTNYHNWGMWPTDQHNKLSENPDYVAEALAVNAEARGQLASDKITPVVHTGGRDE